MRDLLLLAVQLVVTIARLMRPWRCSLGRRRVPAPEASTDHQPPFQSLKFLLLMLAGWISRHQLEVIEYLQEENRVLKERLGGQRLRFTDAERRRLARKARALGRTALNRLETLVTPETLLRWYRELVSDLPN
ncbi:MAG: hypothetical protein ACREV7_21930 [Steroidobacteraceae bacterium]